MRESAVNKFALHGQHIQGSAAVKTLSSKMGAPGGLRFEPTSVALVGLEPPAEDAAPEKLLLKLRIRCGTPYIDPTICEPHNYSPWPRLALNDYTPSPPPSPPAAPPCVAQSTDPCPRPGFLVDACGFSDAVR